MSSDAVTEPKSAHANISSGSCNSEGSNADPSSLPYWATDIAAVSDGGRKDVCECAGDCV